MHKSTHTNHAYGELPQRPMIPPLTPPTDDPNTAHAAPSMIYVQQASQWDYRILDYSLADAAVLNAADFDELGTEGWELVAIVPLEQKIRYYFKRHRG